MTRVETVRRRRPVREQGLPKAHRLEGKVENRGLKMVRKKPKPPIA